MILSACLIKNNNLRLVTIMKIKRENSFSMIFSFKDPSIKEAKPGQFIMLWIPGIDEIPLSIMNYENNEISVLVKAVGEATNKLLNSNNGDIVGIRGPFGNGFTNSENKVLLIGGGTGVAPLFFLIKKLKIEKKKFTFIYGAKKKEELLLLESLQDLCSNQTLICTTEDGSYGLNCTVTTPIKSFLNKNEINLIYACGPELMLYKVFNIAENFHLPLEASLERFMRCGIGLCGSCVIGPYRVCKDGPIFDSTKLRQITSEFGKKKLDIFGKFIPL